MIEPEMAFCDLAGDMDVAEAMIKYIIKTVLDRCPAEMEFFNKFVDPGLLERLDVVLKNDFVRLSYTKAVELLLESGAEFKYPVGWGEELQTEHERYLTEQIFKCPVFVTDYPKDFKAFYMRLNDDGKTVAAADLLVPGVGEIIGGSQREERLDMLEKRITELGMELSQYDWYLELRKFGGVGRLKGVELLLRDLDVVRDLRRIAGTADSFQGFRGRLQGVFRACLPAVGAVVLFGWNETSVVSDNQIDVLSVFAFSFQRCFDLFRQVFAQKIFDSFNDHV